MTSMTLRLKRNIAMAAVSAIKGDTIYDFKLLSERFLES